jgi:hypothetical protein
VLIFGLTYGGKISESGVVAVGETTMAEGLQAEMVEHFWSTDEAHFLVGAV